jgi:hypothetical protein
MFQNISKFRVQGSGRIIQDTFLKKVSGIKTQATSYKLQAIKVQANIIKVTS